MHIFSLPRLIYYGSGASEMLGELAKNLGWKRVLLVCDPVVEKLGLASKVEQALRNTGVEVRVYDKVEPEPLFSQAEEIGRLAQEFEPQAIVAVGGGSVIDAAKGAWVKYERPDYDLRGVTPFEWMGLGKKCMLVAIPTTSGTGSEATLGIVLSEPLDGGKRKVALGSPEVVSMVAVLDPDLAKTMPRRLTISTGVDVLAHAVEAVVSSEASEFTDALAFKATEIVFTYLPRAVENPDDMEARSKMHLAATMAGMAFSNSGLGLAHAVAHAMGPVAGLPHGTSVGIALPFVVEYNSAKSSNAAEKYGKLLSYLEVMARVEADTLAAAIKELYSRIGQPETVAQAGGDAASVQARAEEIVDEAFQDPDLVFNPVFPDRGEVVEMVKKMAGEG